MFCQIIQVTRLIDDLWRCYPNGLVAHLQKRAVPKVEGLAKYIIKYVMSPPIALSRIIKYDREKGKADHQSGQKQEEELSRADFIGRMVQHILPKGFQRIRYYGLQAICKLEKVTMILKHTIKRVVQGVFDFAKKAAAKLNYRERIKQAYGKDPFICERCGTEMWLWRIWHPDYGVLYDELERIKAGKYDLPAKSLVGKKVKKEAVVQPLLFCLPSIYV